MDKKRILIVDDEAAAAKKQEVVSRGGRIGGLPFLAKPADLPDVIACLEQHLGKPARPS